MVYSLIYSLRAFKAVLMMAIPCTSYDESMKTQKITLSKSCSYDQDVDYPAVDVLFSPTDRSVSCLFQFMSDTNVSTKPNLNRSITLVNIHYLNLSSSSDVCPRLRMCSITPSILSNIEARPPAIASNYPTVNMCPLSSSLAASCRSVLSTVHYFLIPRSSSLFFQVDMMDDSPHLFQSSVNFVASTGVLLGLGETDCPLGYFACINPAKNLTQQPFDKSDFKYPPRICLLNYLRCDGFVNCPNNGSDEADCFGPTPTEFNIHPDQLRHELARNAYASEQLSESSFQIIWFLSFLPLLLLIIFSGFVYHYRLSLVRVCYRSVNSPNDNKIENNEHVI